ncbi:MAG: MXAN_6640 family putative metalloprotease [Gaiellaceae bacterium]
MRALGGTVLVLAAFAVWTGAATAQQRPLPALAPAADDALGDALSEGELTEAQYALERARSLFRLRAVRREFGQVERADGRDATLILRDLAVRLRELSGPERRRAERLLARPTEGVDDPQGFGYEVAEAMPHCGDEMCFHWVDTTDDSPRVEGEEDPVAVPVPAQVLFTQSIFEEVWNEIVGLDGMGYEEPLSDETDATNGGDEKLDIYLVDIGNDGLYGYCAHDGEPLVSAVAVYCVVDNDYVELAAGTDRDPDDLLRVTAAHEFFHAVQGAYDFFEDGWLMEGTATNMEETVYETIDDNLMFLDFSPLTRPASPLDRWGFGNSEYGSWIFWRYLEERAYGSDPSVIRRIWQRAAASRLDPSDWGEYSLQAVARVLADDGVHLADAFAGFGVANRLLAYADGNLYPGTPTHRAFRIGPAQRRTRWLGRRMNHLTTQYFSFRPRKKVSRKARLGVNVDVHPRGGRARVIVFFKNGKRAVRAVRLDGQGNGNRRVPFGRATVRRVDLVLSNGSSRTRCWRFPDPPWYSCFGIPKDDRRIYRFRAILRG